MDLRKTATNYSAMCNEQAGFTTVELVVVLVLLGILAAYIAPNFTGRDGFSELTVQQDLKQSFRFAQQLAMSRTNSTIALVTSATNIDIGEIVPPGNFARFENYSKQLPSDVPLGERTVTFDRLGRANFDGRILVKNGRDICVTGATGYARDC